MSRTYTTYWADWLYGRAPQGAPLDQVWGGWNAATQYMSSTLAPGDRLVVITVTDGLVYLLARMTVTDKLTRAEFEALHPEQADSPHASGSCVVMGRDGTPLRFGLAFPAARVEADWRYETPRGAERPLKHVVEGRIRRIPSLQGCFRLAPRTAARVHALFDPDPDGLAALEAAEPARALVRAVCASPGDREAAAVLADAWLETDDPRGEVLRAELDLATEPRARARRLRALVQAHGDAILGRPGGFPFRAAWAPPLR